MNKHTTGIIVARFQTARLTPGHVHLINTALLQNDAVMIYLGESPVKNSRQKPINFYWRAAAVQGDSRLFTAGKSLVIRPIRDQDDDEVWSRHLQEDIIANAPVKDSLFRLYGSRDSSALTGFHGDYECIEILPLGHFSATQDRQMIAEKFPTGRETDDYIREGMIKAAYERYPAVVSTVDVAIFNYQDKKLGVWLGRKPNQKKFRFIGGFADPNSKSDEEDAIREAKEETNMDIEAVTYIGNMFIDDWRYKKEQDKIRTRIFAAVGVDPDIRKAGDDIGELLFVPVGELATFDIFNDHIPLRDKIVEWLDSVAAREFFFTYL